MPKKVMFLESQLDKKLTSPRSQIGFMKSFLGNYSADLELVAREVNTRQDLLKFLDVARKRKDTPIIHFVGHGQISKNKCSLVLTGNERIDLRKDENQAIFRNLDRRVLFFSCCEIGSDVQVMRKILRRSKADAIFSYSRNVYDDQAFLIESMFYHLYLQPYSYRALYEKLRFAITYLGIDNSDEDVALSHPLLVADFWEDLEKG